MYLHVKPAHDGSVHILHLIGACHKKPFKLFEPLDQFIYLTELPPLPCQPARSHQAICLINKKHLPRFSAFLEHATYILLGFPCIATDNVRSPVLRHLQPGAAGQMPCNTGFAAARRPVKSNASLWIAPDRLYKPVQRLIGTDCIQPVWNGAA